MFKKNTAVTGFTIGLVATADGSDITTGTPVGYYTLDGGTQTAIGDVTPVHEGNGQWSFDLTAGEMNGDIVSLVFTHGSAISVHFTIKTDTKITSELQDLTAAQVNTEVDTGISDAALATAAAVATVDGNVDLILTDTADIQPRVVAIELDTNELQGDWTNNGRLDLILDIIAADTTTDIPALIAALNDLSAAQVNTEVDNALNTAIPGSPTANSINERIAAIDDLTQSGGSGDLAAVLTDTADIQPKIGTPSADISADLAAVQSDTDDIQSRLPAALVGGKMDSDAVAVGGSTDGANRLGKATQANVFCTIGSGSTTTSLVTSSMDPSAAVIDQFKGKIVTFDANTTTANLRGQSTDITGSTAAGVLTVTALTTSAVSGDTFVIT